MSIAFAALDQQRKDQLLDRLDAGTHSLPRSDRTAPPQLQRENAWAGHEPGLYVFDDLKLKWIVRSGADLEAVEDCRVLWEMTRYV